MPNYSLDEEYDVSVNKEEFAPKSSADYTVAISAIEQVRHRSHEDLIYRYGKWTITQGYNPSTNCHPIDLIVRQSDHRILVEAKIIQDLNVTKPAREAIGQLYEYRYCYSRDRQMYLALLLNRRLDPEYIELLESLNIACIWQEGVTWLGSPTAVELGLGVD